MANLMNRLVTDHRSAINDVEMDYNGVRLATCSSDGIIKIFNLNLNGFTHAADLRGHFGPVMQVSWAHPKFGKILASCSIDKSVLIWKEENKNKWNKIYEYKNHDGSVNCVKFGPQEFRLTFACASSDGAISILTVKENLSVWNINKIKDAHNERCVNAVSWSPFMSLNDPVNSTTNIKTNSKIQKQQNIKINNITSKSTTKSLKRIVSAGSDFLVKIWAEFKDSWNEIIRLDHHTDWVRDVAWAPSTSLITRIASASQDKNVIIWSSVDQIHWETKQLPAFEDAVHKVSWSPTGNVLSVSDDTNKVTLWKEAQNGEWQCFTVHNK